MDFWLWARRVWESESCLLRSAALRRSVSHIQPMRPAMPNWVMVVRESGPLGGSVMG